MKLNKRLDMEPLQDIKILLSIITGKEEAHITTINSSFREDTLLMTSKWVYFFI